MFRSAANKMMWVGRATMFLVGLAVILALTVGVVSKAAAHAGSAGLFHLGHNNPVSALSTLAGNLATGVLQATNTNTTDTTGKAVAVGATTRNANAPAIKATNSGGGPALGLSVGSGKAPMTVSNGAAKVTNLDADKVDGHDAPMWAVITNGGLALRWYGMSGNLRTSTGQYTISFNRNITECAYTATVGEPSRIISLSEAGSQSIFVDIVDRQGVHQDAGFHLVVNC